MFPSLRPPSLLAYYFFLSSLSFSPLRFGVVACYRKETVLLPSSSSCCCCRCSLRVVLPLLLSSALPSERRATQPCSLQKHAVCRSASIRFPDAKSAPMYMYVCAFTECSYSNPPPPKDPALCDSFILTGLLLLIGNAPFFCTLAEVFSQPSSPIPKDFTRNPLHNQ